MKVKFFYGWIIVAIATLSLLISNGLSIGGFPVFYKSIREDFVRIGAVEASQAESFIGLGAALTFLTAGFISPFAGWLIQKFSTKKMMIVGCFILGIALILHSQAQTAWLVYFSRILMGASLGFVGVLATTVLVASWFVRLRGTAIGILLTGTSFGGVLIPQIASPLIERYGWRTAMISVSLIIWLILLPAIIFLVKNKPSEIGLFPDGDESPIDENVAVNVKNQEGLTLFEAMRTPIFWVFALCAALIFYPIFVTSQQFILYLQSEKIGLSLQQSSYAQSALFIVSVAGKFFFGFLSDRMSPTKVMLICCTVMFLATLILLNLTAITAFIFLIPFGLGYGGTFVLLQRLVADYFGNRDYPKILGVITVVETVGASVGGIITGRLADMAGGDYTQAFYAVIIVTGLALASVIALSFMHKERKPAIQIS
ncbi:MAG: MFS transporter [Acidobacteria bacterium]|jgi:MFS family permease|nr:MAG: MFS transporter [Acidobacteriota bacterium]GIU82390.1 MAG: MFS transporter [Pyrinomonadaceae bacterium]